MVRLRKLSATEKQRITSDWARLFPSMGVYEPMSIGRRVGPMLHGISLGLSSDNARYSPALHIHNLCRPLGFVTLGMRQPLLTQRTRAEDSIAIQFHEKHVEEAAERLASSSFLPVGGDMSMKQVLGALREMRIRKLGDWNYPISAMEDAVMLYGWLGCEAEAQALLNQFLAEIETWPERMTARDGGVSSWFEKMRSLISEPENLRATALEQAETLKLTHLPVSRLLP